MIEITRRTFEALKHPKGSPEREALNRNSITSEYQPSNKYVVQNEAYSFAFRTKKEAIAFVDKETRMSEERVDPSQKEVV